MGRADDDPLARQVLGQRAAGSGDATNPLDLRAASSRLGGEPRPRWRWPRGLRTESSI